MRILISLTLCLMLCACGVEPEDRSFVTAISVNSEGVNLLTAEGSVKDENEEKNQGIITGKGDTVAKAVKDCALKSSGRLFFGHTAVCIIDSELAGSKSALIDLAKYMAEETEVSRRVVLLQAENTEKIMNAEDKNIGDFVKKYYKAHRDYKPVELDSLCKALAESESLTIPTLKYENEAFIIQTDDN